MQNVILLVLEEEVFYFLANEKKWMVFLRVKIRAKFRYDGGRQVRPLIRRVIHAIHWDKEEAWISTQGPLSRRQRFIHSPWTDPSLTKGLILCCGAVELSLRWVTVRLRPFHNTRPSSLTWWEQDARVKVEYVRCSFATMDLMSKAHVLPTTPQTPRKGMTVIVTAEK